MERFVYDTFAIYLLVIEKRQLGDMMSNAGCVNWRIPQVFIPRQLFIYTDDVLECLKHATPQLFTDDTILRVTAWYKHTVN